MAPIRTNKTTVRHNPILDEDDDYDYDDDEFPNPIYGGKNHPGVHIWKINPVKARRHKKRPMTFKTKLGYFGVSGYVLEEELTIETPMPIATGSWKGKERDPGGGILVCEPPNPQQMQLTLNNMNKNYPTLETLRNIFESFYTGAGVEMRRSPFGRVIGWNSDPKKIRFFVVGSKIVQQLADSVGGLDCLKTVGLIRRFRDSWVMLLPKPSQSVIGSVVGSVDATASRGRPEAAPVSAMNTGIGAPVWSRTGPIPAMQKMGGYPQIVPISLPAVNTQWSSMVPSGLAQPIYGYPLAGSTMGYPPASNGVLQQPMQGYSPAAPVWAVPTGQYPPVLPMQGMDTSYRAAPPSVGPVWPTQGYLPVQNTPSMNAGWGLLPSMGPTQLIQTMQQYPVAPAPQINAGYVAPPPLEPVQPAQGCTPWAPVEANVGCGTQPETAPTEQVSDASSMNETQPFELDWSFIANYLNT